MRADSAKFRGRHDGCPYQLGRLAVAAGAIGSVDVNVVHFSGEGAALWPLGVGATVRCVRRNRNRHRVSRSIDNKCGCHGLLLRRASTVHSIRLLDT